MRSQVHFQMHRRYFELVPPGSYSERASALVRLALTEWEKNGPATPQQPDEKISVTTYLGPYTLELLEKFRQAHSGPYIAALRSYLDRLLEQAHSTSSKDGAQ